MRRSLGLRSRQFDPGYSDERKVEGLGIHLSLYGDIGELESHFPVTEEWRDRYPYVTRREAVVFHLR